MTWEVGDYVRYRSREGAVGEVVKEDVGQVLVRWSYGKDQWGIPMRGYSTFPCDTDLLVEVREEDFKEEDEEVHQWES